MPDARFETLLSACKQWRNATLSRLRLTGKRGEAVPLAPDQALLDAISEAEGQKRGAIEPGLGQFVAQLLNMAERQQTRGDAALCCRAVEIIEDQADSIGHLRKLKDRKDA